MAFLYAANRISRAAVSNSRFVRVRPGFSAQFAVGLCGRLAWDSFWLGIDATCTVAACTTAGAVAGFASVPTGSAGAGCAHIVTFGVTWLLICGCWLAVHVVPFVVGGVAVCRVALTLYRGELHCLQT